MQQVCTLTKSMWVISAALSLPGSASFGARRDFLLRHNRERDRKVSFPLGDGDILVMGGTTQVSMRAEPN